MSNNRDSAAGAGCGALVLLAVAIWAFLWVVKIGMVLLGVAMIAAAVIGAIAVPVNLWVGVFRRKAARAELAELDTALVTLSNESAGRLRSSVNWWDDLQRNKGVGTCLEEAYFAEGSHPVDAGLRGILARANTMVETGDQLLHQTMGTEGMPSTREACIDGIEHCDDLALELDGLRRKVTTD
ncbi:MAG TPA: hypothetical protein H9870_06545 [Candidatus Corynebacterium avicola]|uniref:Uncharacterized protein n=1 Tax=Candidatus Corynebacterium avicola TaxID=2838527 RepID=A0A9D1RRD7_9CORY|nr:hypothetical protein [Candidatus Corynebacterium avicola]